MIRSVVALLTGMAALGLARAEDSRAPDSNVAEAKQIVQQFFSRLKGELQGAMKHGGPVKAIQVCQQRAPAIARELSEQTGWDVGRTSLKLRNPANQPDAWELGVLNKFEERKAAGEDPLQICVTCHGSDLAPELEAQLDRLYPNDQARGFRAGDIRGAFTLSKPL